MTAQRTFNLPFERENRSRQRLGEQGPFLESAAQWIGQEGKPSRVGDAQIRKPRVKCLAVPRRQQGGNGLVGIVGITMGIGNPLRQRIGAHLDRFVMKYPVE